jgi:hypothetical protein
VGPGGGEPAQGRVDAREDPKTAPVESGALVIDETGDRKDGKATAHVGKQYLGGIGKIENGVVSVSSLYADERLYYPLEIEPYTPAHHFEGGKGDPAFRTKPRIALELVERAIEMEIPFRAVVGDILYGEHREFRRALQIRGIPYVLAVKPSHGWYLATGGGRETVRQVVGEYPWDGEEEPGEWVALEHSFRDGHTERWWALEPTRWPFGSRSDRRLVVATTDPARLPELTTFYLFTNLPVPEPERGAGNGDLVPADVAEVSRLYALRSWIEQSYKQVKNSLGWAHWDGPITRCARTSRSGGTGSWCAARSASAGGRARSTAKWARHRWWSSKIRRTPLARPRSRAGGKKKSRMKRPLSWPQALRKVRSWLQPYVMLLRYWRAYTDLPPPKELQRLLDRLFRAEGVYLYAH